MSAPVSSFKNRTEIAGADIQSSSYCSDSDPDPYNFSVCSQSQEKSGLLFAAGCIQFRKDLKNPVRMFLYNLRLFKKSLICYLAEQFHLFFSGSCPYQQIHLRIHSIPYIQDDLLQIHAGTASFHKCLTELEFSIL